VSGTGGVQKVEEILSILSLSSCLTDDINYSPRRVDDNYTNFFGTLGDIAEGQWLTVPR